MTGNKELGEARLQDDRLATVQPLITPGEVKHAYPMAEASMATVSKSRDAIREALDPTIPSDKLVVVIGPCSVSDPKQALDYTEWLSEMRAEYGEDMELVQRVYLEKPRSGIGWEGFIFDPDLDGDFEVNEGLLSARKLLLDITGQGVPAATEWLSLDTHEYYGGLVAWGAIGARTIESPLHRWKVSGIPSPVGLKNGISGNVQVAVDAARTAEEPHSIMLTTDEGLRVVAKTSGNPDTHIILRGGLEGPNYSAEDVKEASALIAKAGLKQKLMIDASHGNSRRDYTRQLGVVQDVAGQISSGNLAIMGVMIESNLKAGKQPFNPGGQHEYGVSITDGCVDLEEARQMLEILSGAMQDRRRANS